MKIRTKWEERERERWQQVERVSISLEEWESRMRLSSPRIKDGPHLFVTVGPFFGRVCRSFVRFLVFCANGVIVMEKWTKLPPGQVKKKTIRRGFLFTGNFGFRDVREFTAIAAVSVQMSETLFLKLSHLLVVYVREREYHLLWKEISFLSHFHVRRRAIYNSFTLGNVCRTPSVLFSPSFFFSLPLFSRLCRFFFHARKPWKFLRPPPQNFLTGKQDIPWYRVGSFLDSLPFFCSEFVVFLSFFFFFLVCRVHTNLTAREKIERRGWSFGAQFYEDNKTKYRIETPRPQVLFLLLR